MSIDGAQNYLDEIYSNIRDRTTTWPAIQRSGMINEEQLAKLEALKGPQASQNRDPADTQHKRRVEIIEKDPAGYVKVLFGDSTKDKKTPEGKGLLECVRGKLDLQLLALVILSDALASPKFLDALFDQSKIVNPYSELRLLLKSNDKTTQLLASRTLGLILSYAYNPASKQKPSEALKKEGKEALKELYDYLSQRISDADSNIQALAVQGCAQLLRAKGARADFWEHGQTVEPLIEILKQAAKPEKGGSLSSAPLSRIQPTNGSTSNTTQGEVGLQLLYHVLLVFWSLTFEEVVTSQIQAKYLDLIYILLRLMRSAIKEKIARLSIGILANLIRLSPQQNLPPLSLSTPLTTLAALQERYTADKDLADDLAFLVSSLEHFLSQQTTLDQYAIEVKSGKLTWSPPHRSVDFWKKNAEAIFDYNNGELIKKLLEVLKRGLQEAGNDNARQLTKEDYMPIQIAAHDFAALLNECPHKRESLDEKSVKTTCLGLMASADPELRFEALQVVQLFLKNAFAPKYHANK